jgi:hypothetical protein
MARGVHLEPDAQGLPFEFDTTDARVLIRVGKLHKIVSSAWGQVNRATFNPPRARDATRSDCASARVGFKLHPRRFRHRLGARL